MKKIFAISLFILCLLPSISFAAEMSLSTDKNTFVQNESFLVQVFLDTQNTTVNAVAGTLVFPSDLLTLKEVRDGNSAINFWVEEPRSDSDGNVVFSGITPGGFSGPKMFLFSLVFQAKDLGSGSISFNGIQILQNDGLGTKVLTSENPFIFSINQNGNGSASANLTIKDTDPPENFIPFIAKDPSIFNDKYFLVFSAIDKGSGIDHYEVNESPWFLLGIWGGKYVNAESPYLLKDQNLDDRIYIKAVDKAGNQRIVVLEPQNKLAWLEECLILVIIISICILVYKRIWRKFIQ